MFAVGIMPGQSPDAFSQALEGLLRSVESEPTVVLIDLLGGTPYNMAARHVLRDGVECVTGVNLPMLLEAVMCREGLSPSEIAAAITRAGRDSVSNLGPRLRRGEQPVAG